MTSRQFPGAYVPAVTPQGYFTQPWILWLTPSQAGTPVSVPASASPLSYTAPGTGSLAVSGGTVSAISIKRGTVTVPTGMTSGLVPMLANDIATITYSVAPTINFLPS